MGNTQMEITVQGFGELKELVEKIPDKMVISLKVEEVMACAKKEGK